MQSNKLSQVFYRITPNPGIVQFEKVFDKYVYDNDESGFIRKAMGGPGIRSSRNEVFEDNNFQILQSSQYRLVRLYQIYQKQILLFPQEEQSSSFIEEQRSYNSFMAQSGLVSFEYLRTLFITQKINKQGHYQYFIKRNGEYYVQQCDDWIPIHKTSRKPLWSLSFKHPWQLLLLKAWIKQCGSIQSLENAQPFKFLQAFGLPLYRNYNFRKELKFINSEKKSMKRKKENYDHFVMNRNDVIIIAQTINDERVKNVGLVPNMAGYRILKISKPGQQQIFRVYSSLPCHWIGKLNPVNKTRFNEIYNQNMFLDLQRNFLMKQKQLITYFNKFHVVPIQMNDSQRYITQDCISLDVGHQQSVWLCFEVKDSQGLLGIGLNFDQHSQSQHSEQGENRKNSKQFRYFLSKKRSEQQISKSHFRSDFSIATSEHNLSQYSQSNCDKWQYVYIDYVQEYEDKSNFFCKVTQGFYVLHVISDMHAVMHARFDSFVRMTRPTKYFPSPKQVKQIFDSTFYSISEDVGVEASFTKQTFEESICLNNSFQEFGYGSIVIKTLNKSHHRIAMRVFPQKFLEAGYLVLCNTSDELTLVSKEGRPEIIVLQKIKNRNQSTIGIVFPPPQTVQFLKVTPYYKLLANGAK